MHQWFVKRGRIGIVKDGDFILFDIDSEGSESCLLTALDAKEIADILTVVAHEIWENQTERGEYTQQYKITDSGMYQWVNIDSEIFVSVSDDSSAIVITLIGASPFKMDVSQAVEFIQIVQSFLSA